jgi:hypothetical protein
MKNILISIGILLALSTIYYSCSRNSQDNANVASKLTTHKEAIDSLRIDNTTEKLLVYTKLTKNQLSDLLSALDLSRLFASINPEEPFSNRFDGLYGKDNYRIEIFFAEASKDEENQTIYFIKGKNRFKKTITPFEGIITIDSLIAFEDPNIDSFRFDQESIKHKGLYSAVGKFVLKEDSTAKGSGVFSGKITMDFLVRNDNSVDLWYFSPQTQSKASGFRFIGEWQSYQSKTIKPFIWAKDLFSFANEIIKDFSIGDRDIEINPKYRHLGWDNYWEMDEWWHDVKPAQ